MPLLSSDVTETNELEYTDACVNFMDAVYHRIHVFVCRADALAVPLSDVDVVDSVDRIRYQFITD